MLLADDSHVTERERLIREAEEAMRGAGKLPELPVLTALSDDHLREIIAWHTPLTTAP
jgi:hypothetical protein